MTASGDNFVGGTVTYTTVLTNNGRSHADNPGDEYTNTLPTGLTLVSASATSGTTIANPNTNTVSWNGSLADGGTTTITVTAIVDKSAAEQTLSNQGTIYFDSNGDGTNDATALSDDPDTAESGDPTLLTIEVLDDQLPSGGSGDEKTDTRTDAGTLLKTGTDSSGPIWLGVGLLIVGAVLLMTHRARRNLV